MSQNVRASLFMVLSMAGFSINDAFVKSLDGSLPVSQVIAVRGAFVTLLIFSVMWQQGLIKRFRDALIPRVGMRACMELGATIFFLSALSQMPFASISAILQALPLVVTLGAAIVFREPVGWRRWLAILIGFLGVLIIIRPGSSSFEPASLLMLVSVGFAAARDLFTRALPNKLPSLLVSAVTALVVTLYGVSAGLVQGDWVSLPTEQVVTLATSSVFLFVGYQCIVLGMRIGDVAYVVPYRYTSLLFTIALGYFFFDEIPDSYTMLGSSIVISMGLFTLYREMLRAREKTS